ncbi:MAG: ABC transporter permease [Oscillospiraceae bacterium]
MYRFVIKRILLTLLILLGVSIIIFFILNLTPSDPGRLILGQMAEQSAVDQLNHDLGYDRPSLIRYFDYIKNLVFNFDLGTSYRTGQPVMDEVMLRFPTTLKLAFWSLLFSSIIGIGIGIISAVKQYSAVDTISSVAAMFFSAMPTFWVGLMLILLFSVKLGWLPSGGTGTWESFILPVTTLTLAISAGIMRLTRSAMLDTIRSSYVTTAKAKGASLKDIIFKHELRNAILPISTIIGLQFGAMLGGSMIVESVFSINGVGYYMLSAIRAKDIPVVMGCALFVAALFSIIMLIVDVVQGLMDPRVKARYSA